MSFKVAQKLGKKWRSDDVKANENVNFASLLLSQPVLQGLKHAGFKIPSPVQLKAIPVGRMGIDLIVQAKSGTGKTCVFAVIALELLRKSPNLQILVLSPTREIAYQSCMVINTIGDHINDLECHTFIGGTSVSEDIKKLRSCQIAVGTPGRIRDLIDKKYLLTGCIHMFIMDEADKLMEEGIAKDVAFIYNHLPVGKQVLALSATYPTELHQMLKEYMRKPCSIKIHENELVLKGLLQFYHLIEDHAISNIVAARKQKAVWDILNNITFSQCLIFCNYISRVESLCDWLNNQGYPSTKISSSEDQQSRLETLEQLKLFQFRVLVTSDLTARGIDAANVNLVINLDLPQSLETYLHRIGRAGRYGSKACGITFITTGYEEQKFNDFEANGNFVTYPLPDNIPNDLISWTLEGVREATTSKLKKTGEDFEKIQSKIDNLACDDQNGNNAEFLVSSSSSCSSSLESIPDKLNDGCNNNAEAGIGNEEDEDASVAEISAESSVPSKDKKTIMDQEQSKLCDKESSEIVSLKPVNSVNAATQLDCNRKVIVIESEGENEVDKPKTVGQTSTPLVKQSKMNCLSVDDLVNSSVAFFASESESDQARSAKSEKVTTEPENVVNVSDVSSCNATCGSICDLENTVCSEVLDDQKLSAGNSVVVLEDKSDNSRILDSSTLESSCQVKDPVNVVVSEDQMVCDNELQQESCISEDDIQLVENIKDLLLKSVSCFEEDLISKEDCYTGVRNLLTNEFKQIQEDFLKHTLSFSNIYSNFQTNFHVTAENIPSVNRKLAEKDMKFLESFLAHNQQDFYHTFCESFNFQKRSLDDVKDSEVQQEEIIAKIKEKHKSNTSLCDTNSDVKSNAEPSVSVSITPHAVLNTSSSPCNNNVLLDEIKSNFSLKSNDDIEPKLQILVPSNASNDDDALSSNHDSPDEIENRVILKAKKRLGDKNKSFGIENMKFTQNVSNPQKKKASEITSCDTETSEKHLNKSKSKKATKFPKNNAPVIEFVPVETNKTKSSSACESKPMSNYKRQVEDNIAAGGKNYNVNERKNDIAHHRLHHRKEENILPVIDSSDEQSKFKKNKVKGSKKVFKEKLKHHEKSLKYQKGSKYHSKRDSSEESDIDQNGRKYQPLMNLYYKQLRGQSDETEEIDKYSDSSSEECYESNRRHSRHSVSSGHSRKFHYYPPKGHSDFTVPFEWPLIHSSSFEGYDCIYSNEYNHHSHDRSNKKISRGGQVESQRSRGHYSSSVKKHDRKSNIPFNMPTSHVVRGCGNHRGYGYLPCLMPSIYHPSPLIYNISNVCESCVPQEHIHYSSIGSHDCEDMHCRGRHLHEQFLKSLKKDKPREKKR